jgi:uncharacterized membrane protein YqaE (UPF0057 family)
MKLVKVIFCFFLPPLAAFLQTGASTHFWINLVLTICIWVPGVIHALWLVLTNQKAAK